MVLLYEIFRFQWGHLLGVLLHFPHYCLVSFAGMSSLRFSLVLIVWGFFFRYYETTVGSLKLEPGTPLQAIGEWSHLEFGTHDWQRRMWGNISRGFRPHGAYGVYTGCTIAVPRVCVPWAVSPLDRK